MVKLPAVARARKRPFSISFVIPGFEDGKVPNRVSSTKLIKEHFPAYIFKHPITGKTYTSSKIIKNADRSVVYTAYHPLSMFAYESYQRDVDNQMSDCFPSNFKRDQGWRYIAGEHGVIAEWEGAWIRNDGHYFFLDAKHIMTTDQLANINSKLTRSTTHLNISRSNTTTFLAGNIWFGDSVMTEAENTYRFGIVQANGEELDVKEPSTS